MRIYGERNEDAPSLPLLRSLSLPASLPPCLEQLEIILDTFYFDRKRFARRSPLIAESSGYVRSQASSNRETPRKISRR